MNNLKWGIIIWGIVMMTALFATTYIKINLMLSEVCPDNPEYNYFIIPKIGDGTGFVVNCKDWLREHPQPTNTTVKSNDDIPATNAPFIQVETMLQIVNFTGVVNIGRYSFVFQDDAFFNSLQPPLTSSAGYTFEGNRIWIRTGRALDNTYVTCVHEVLHNLIVDQNATFEEELIDSIDYMVRLDVCNALMEKIS